MMRNWDLREFCVQVNVPSPIWQVQVPIRHVITPIRGLPNPLRQVVPLFSHIHLYPPHCSHLHPLGLSFSSITLSSLQNTKLSDSSLSLHAMIMSWHRVQHTPSTASTQHCLSSLHSHDYKLTAEYSFSFRRASIHDQHPSASSPWERNGIVTLSHSHGCESTNWWIESGPPGILSIDCLEVLVTSRTITASNCISKLAHSQPQCVSPNSLDHGVEVHLQSRSITASKCIFDLEWSPPPSSYDHSLQVHLLTHSITASKCISTIAQLRPPRSPHLGLQVHLPTHPITACKCISKLAWLLPPRVTQILHHYGIQGCSITPSECISEFRRLSFSSPPRIALNHRLLPVEIYSV